MADMRRYFTTGDIRKILSDYRNHTLVYEPKLTFAQCAYMERIYSLIDLESNRKVWFKVYLLNGAWQYSDWYHHNNYYTAYIGSTEIEVITCMNKCGIRSRGRWCRTCHGTIRDQGDTNEDDRLDLVLIKEIPVSQIPTESIREIWTTTIDIRDQTEYPKTLIDRERSMKKRIVKYRAKLKKAETTLDNMYKSLGVTADSFNEVINGLSLKLSSSLSDSTSSDSLPSELAELDIIMSD